MAVAGFPSGALYVEALQNTTLCFQDPELIGASPRNDKLGRPRAISGNFASVFSLTTHTGRRYAVKCFTRAVADQEYRYQAISDHLAGLRCPWKVGFEYLRNGVLVGGKWYPALKMEWVEATSLTRWIDLHLHVTGALAGLADRFASLVAELSAHDIGHGDLQHGNMLVAADGTLRLVDYDGMYVPALSGSPAVEMGHRNYQSPARSATDFGPMIDRFSVWVVYLSLVALAVDPMLWGQLREQDAEHLLLAEEDYTSPAGSFRLNTLARHPDFSVRSIAGRLRGLLEQQTSIPPELSRVALHIDMPTAQPVDAALPVGGLPGWMAGHFTPEPMPECVFSKSANGLRAMGIAAAVTVPLAVVAAVLGVVAATVMPVLLAVIWFCWSTAAYRRRPETGQARSVNAEVKEISKRVAAASGYVTQLDKHARRLDRSAVEMNAKYTARRHDLQIRHQHEFTGVQHGVQQRTARVEGKLQQLKNECARALSTELERVQAEHVGIHLARFRISEGVIHGIGPTLVSNLRRAGIGTAADFTGVTYSSGQQHQNRIAYFRLASGDRVRVTGVGEVKANSLERWRTSHLRRAQSTQPTSLPQLNRKAMESRFAARESTLLGERGHIVEEGNRQREAMAGRHAADQAALANESRRAVTEVANVKAEHARTVKEARNALAAIQRQHSEVLAKAGSYSLITYVNFVAFTVTGKSSNRA